MQQEEPIDTLGPDSESIEIIYSDININIPYKNNECIISDTESEVDYSDMPELIEVSDSDFICEPESETNLESIMRNIEAVVNPTSVSESLNLLNNPDQLLQRIQDAFDSFKSQTGRTMTYSEMRYMMG
jgi:hypothetical protein